MLYSIVFLFENVLSRQSGVIFFSFIIHFLIMVSQRNKEEEIVLDFGEQLNNENKKRYEQLLV